jgi:hypothetical protein
LTDAAKKETKAQEDDGAVGTYLLDVGLAYLLSKVSYYAEARTGDRLGREMKAYSFLLAAFRQRRIC